MHLPNGSKIFIESSRDSRTYSARGLDVNRTAEAYTFVFLLGGGQEVNFRIGNIVLVTTSDFPSLRGKVLRVTAVGGGRIRVAYEPLIYDQTLFPAVDGIVNGNSTVVRITGWTELPCVQSIDKEGGEQNWYTYQCLNSGREERQKTTKSALFMSYVLAHDPGNPTYEIMKSFEKSKLLMAAYMHIPRAKENRYWSGGVSFDEIPSTAVNEMEAVTLRMAIRGNYNFLPSS